MKLVVALAKFCRVEGETTTEFMGQIRKLDDSDRSWFKKQFIKAGVPIED